VGIKERLQRIAWTIGRQFCEVDERDLLREQRTLLEAFQTIHLQQEENNRVIAEQTRQIEQGRLHRIDCNERHAVLEGQISDLITRLTAINADRLDLLRLVTNGIDVPNLTLLEDHG
jgi:hypothetical protein